MESLRRWLFRPRRNDRSLLAQFFFADEGLNIIANELDSFDGRKDPERCTSLVNQLRQSQDKVLNVVNAIMDDLLGDERASRDFRVKFPEDVLQENLAGQLWFGAECLAAGSSIMNREVESCAMRPLAKAVTKSLENVRNLLRETCLQSNTPNGPISLDHNELFTELLVESLKIFDKLFAEFELAYVSAMVPVKSTREYELQQIISVLFSETVQRSLRLRLFTQDMIDSCDPALMFIIPRLSIVCALAHTTEDILALDGPPDGMSILFQPFRTLILKIRKILRTLDTKQIFQLETMLCDNTNASQESSACYKNYPSTSRTFTNLDFEPQLEDIELNATNSRSDKIHRLFVCITGTAYHLQTNFATDMRNILQLVFLINSTKSNEGYNDTILKSNHSRKRMFYSSAHLNYRPIANGSDNIHVEDNVRLDFRGPRTANTIALSPEPNLLAQEALFDFQLNDSNASTSRTSSNVSIDFDVASGVDNPTAQIQLQNNDFFEPPIWISDDQAPLCMSCECRFTIFKRRHHCRNCGKVMCAQCSSNRMPLPKYGYLKPVRICNKCFVLHLVASAT